MANSIFQMLNFPNVDLFPTPIVCISSSGQSSLGDRHMINGLELSTCICISINTINSSQNTSISVQNSSYFFSLASSSLVLRGVATTNISPESTALLSKITNTSKRKILTSKSPLRVIKQSIRDKKFSQNVAGFVSKSRRASTQKVL